MQWQEIYTAIWPNGFQYFLIRFLLFTLYSFTLDDDDESENWDLGVCTQSLVVLAAAPLLLAGMRAHPNLTPTTLFIIAPSAFLSHFQVGQTLPKQTRKLQATLPIRNYDPLTDSLTDGGEV